MCGGAATTLLALQKIRQERPCKIIIDRFAQSFESFADLDTLSSGGALINNVDMRTLTSRTLKGSALLILFYTCYYLFILGLILLKCRYDFASIVRSLPEEDVLILQAKGGKHISQGYEVDLLVHPKNDLRTCVKDRRQKHRNTFKNLCNYCSNLAELAPEELRLLFKSFYSIFLSCLALIDNEKLRSQAPVTYRTCIHSTIIYQLQTRHSLPLANFFQGFFAKTGPDIERRLQLLPYPTVDDILFVLKSDRPESDFPAFKLVFAKHLHEFLKLLQDERDYIAYMSSRVRVSSKGLADIMQPVNALLKTMLFKNLCKVSRDNVHIPCQRK